MPAGGMRCLLQREPGPGDQGQRERYLPAPGREPHACDGSAPTREPARYLRTRPCPPTYPRIPVIIAQAAWHGYCWVGNTTVPRVLLHVLK